MLELRITEDFDGEQFSIKHLITNEELCNTVDTKGFIYQVYKRLNQEMVLAIATHMEEDDA